MTISIYSLLGAFIMLVFGVVEYAVLRQTLHHVLWERYERAKSTGSQGRDPEIMWTVLKLSNLVLFPLLGFVFGDSVLRALLG